MTDRIFKAGEHFREQGCPVKDNQGKEAVKQEHHYRKVYAKAGCGCRLLS